MGELEEKAGKESEWQNNLSSFYDIRLTFKKNSEKVAVSFRSKKERRPRKKYISIPLEIEELIPSWGKYRKRIIATYHRKKDGKYYGIPPKHLKMDLEGYGGTTLPHMLGQKLEGLVRLAYGSLLKK